MMLAITRSGIAEATPGARGVCPACDALVIAKCGPLVVRHWAHAAADDCDSWSEPESEWHRGWKIAFRSLGANVEVPLGKHRADIVTASGVIELQHSSIGLDEALEREAFYDPMVWLFDMRDPERWERIHWGKRGFWWKHGSKTQANLRRPIYWQNPEGEILRVGLNVVATERGSRVLGRVLTRMATHEFLSSTLSLPTGGRAARG